MEKYTIGKKEQAEIVAFAGKVGFTLKTKTEDGKIVDEYVKQIKFCHAPSQNLLFIHKEIDHKELGFKVGVHPGKFLEALCNGSTISLWLGRKGSRYTPHSAYKGFPVTGNSKEPSAICYRVKGGVSSLEDFLKKIGAEWNSSAVVAESPTNLEHDESSVSRESPSDDLKGLASFTQAEIEGNTELSEGTSPSIIENSTTNTSAISPNVGAKLDSEVDGLKTAEREAVVKVRYGQGSFRDALIKIDGEKCWMSGIEGRRLLIASHIKPWSDCGDDDIESRGQPNNGILLSALWDTAFDAGLISFEADGRVIASSELADSAKRALGFDDYTLLPDKYMNSRRSAYLAYHRKEVFENWKKPKTSDPLAT